MSSSDRSAPSDSSDNILPPHGGYRRLKSFQVSECLYDGTVIFCDRFIDKRSRTHDQMVQAARSGARNIPEGSEASGTSKKTELKLTNVSKASLEELLLDLVAFLRQRRLRLWPKDSPEAMVVRNKYKSDGSDPSDSPPPPACPQCGKPMRRRTARQGPRAGQDFWGCSAYPDCRDIVPIPPIPPKPCAPSDLSDRSDSSGAPHP